MNALNDVINRQIGGQFRRGVQFLEVRFSRFQQRFRLHQTHRRQQHDVNVDHGQYASKNGDLNGEEENEDDDGKAANGNLPSNSSL